FEIQAGIRPTAVAVSAAGAQLTYEELNRKANQLAHHLRRLGVAPGVMVAVSLDRSLEMVVALLGILKAGVAYVPLDPSFPRERLSYMLADSRVRVLVTRAALRESLPVCSAQILCLETACQEIAAEGEENLNISVQPDDLAYVIYTSGSTGRPK